MAEPIELSVDGAEAANLFQINPQAEGKRFLNLVGDPKLVSKFFHSSQ